jgi:hypothetical protein
MNKAMAAMTPKTARTTIKSFLSMASSWRYQTSEIAGSDEDPVYRDELRPSEGAAISEVFG